MRWRTRWGRPRAIQLDDESSAAWRSRIQIGWVAAAAGFTAVAALDDGWYEPDRRIEVLVGGFLAVLVFVSILATLLFALIDTKRSARDILVVSFTAGLFVVGATYSLGLMTVLTVAAIGSFAVFVVAVLPPRLFEDGLSQLVMMIGVPALMAGLALPLHAVLAFVPTFEQNILFFPTSVGAVAGLFVGLMLRRSLRSGPSATRERTSTWTVLGLAFYGIVGGALAYWQPHGWMQRQGRWLSVVAAASWAGFVLTPLLWRIRRIAEATGAARITTVAERLWSHRRSFVAVAVVGAMIHIAAVWLIASNANADDDGYDLAGSFVVETSSSVTVTLGVIVSLLVLKVAEVPLADRGGDG